MDTHVKEGQLYVQHQKFGKKWKKNWFVLFPASQNGIARLEFYDSGGGGGSGSGSTEKSRKLDKKIIRLSECISILPALTESCPKENMSAFCVETNDKTHVFSAERSTAKDWMDTMCDIAFKGGSSSSAAADPNGGGLDLQMSENLIYYSREEVTEFWVSVQRTEASERCGMTGSYWLKAESDILILKEPKTKRDVLAWPYKLLRRYGRDRVMFSFEAGRRCDSGPGNFTFDTKQGNEIFTLVDQAIQSQKVQAEERHLSSPLNFDPDCPSSLQHIRNAPPSSLTGSGDSSSCSSREADGDSGGSKPGSADGVLGKREALYSEPADSVRLPLHAGDCLYSDPVDTIKAQSQSSTHPVAPPRLRPAGDDAPGVQGDHHLGGRKLPDLYSHVYDRISLELSQKTGVLSLNGAAGGGRGGNSNRRPPGGQTEGALTPPAARLEHIYDEPEGRASTGKSGMTIYDEACLEPHIHRRKDEAAPSGPEGTYQSRGTPPPPAPRWPKPFTGPKPGRMKKEPVPLPPGKHGGNNVNNNNNLWVGGDTGQELYSKVSKKKPPPADSWDSLRSPECIYDNLGDV
ncbi:hypothetical protein CesoFtcFv8_027045 [Champsocephalus esox]|uniref:Docking protein 1b n=1 Tax=Champsocephalus esox TaxID=159716 RepID=A0AAN8B0S8_9TELE|nr:hypothetical protein CesoFtcFv8_027045 [Champsocephalus esox]